MSWQLASFLILAAVLVAGFAWYERSRPPAQVVALVAALAALAIAGRIAFAAFPNVKPTTDIVVFAGYALGGAPGFAVGALVALVSNLWFGQGPWTPWQMAGWGMCGVLGAAAALGGRNIGRLGLAAICGFAGIAYGALLNFSLMATYGGDLSLERFGVLQARALPFDLAHVAGNVAFALLAGPAMVRMLARFRERFEWRRAGAAPPAPRRLRPRLQGGAALLALLAVALLAGPLPARAEAAGVSSAAAWLHGAQNPDGGFGSSPEDESGAEMTAWAMLGLEAAGENPLDAAALGGRTPVDFLRGNLDQVKSPGDLARTILALEGAGVDPRDFGGADLVSRLLDKRRDNGSYVGWPGSTAFAVIALRAAGAADAVSSSLDWLRKVQNDDGGWGDVPGSPSTADGTGAVMQALSPESKAARNGINYLRQAQRPGGGFPLGGNGGVNTQSTAWAIQGILALGGDPDSYRRGGTSAPEYLAHQQAADGHYRYSKSSDQTPVWVTGQVLVAAAGKSYPLAPPPREPQPLSGKPGTPIPGVSSGPGPATPVAPAVPPSSAGSTGGAVPPAIPESGGVGAAPGAASPGAGGAGVPALPETAPAPEAGEPEPVEPLPAPEAETTEADEDESKSSPLGAAAVGLAAGALLFGAGFGIRKLWMRWRYGL